MTEHSEHIARLRFTYSRSKLEGEKKVQQFCKMEGISCFVLRPSAVYGSEDWKWSYEMVDRIARFYWPLINGGRAVFTPVFIENLCRVILLAIESKKSDLILNITDDLTVSWKEFYDKIAGFLGVPLHVKNVPSPVALSVAALVGFTNRTIYPGRAPTQKCSFIKDRLRQFFLTAEEGIMLVWRPEYLEITVIFLLFTLFHLLYTFEHLDALFWKHRAGSKKSYQVKAVFLHRALGILLLVIFPLMCARLLAKINISKHGIALSLAPGLLLITFILCAILSPVLYFYFKSPEAEKDLTCTRGPCQKIS